MTKTMPRTRTMNPKVSVVLVTYNQASFLRESIDSVIAQKPENFELIIVNDSSPDATREVLAAYEGLPNVQIVHNETNRGLQRSTDDAIRRAQGEYVLWTSGDDVHLPGLLEAECAVLDRNPQVGFVYCRAYFLAPDGEVKGLVSVPDKPWLEHDYIRSGLEEFEALLHGNHVATTGAVLFRRSLYHQVGGLDVDLPEASDWDLWLSLCLVSDAAHIAAPLFGWRRHDGTLTTAMLRTGRSQLDGLDVVRKALSRAPKHAARISGVAGEVLGKAYLKLAAYEYLAGTEGAGSASERAAHSREARAFLAKALRVNPRLVWVPVNFKLGVCVLLGPIWGPRAVRFVRIAGARPRAT